MKGFWTRKTTMLVTDFSGYAEKVEITNFDFIESCLITVSLFSIVVLSNIL